MSEETTEHTEHTETKQPGKPSIAEGCREVLAKLEDGRGVTLFECMICRGLFRIREPAQRCCEKTSRCQDCGELTEYPYAVRCNACGEQDAIRKWNVMLTAPATESITWEQDHYGTVESFWDAQYDIALDQADEEKREPVESDFRSALEGMRPHNTEPVRIRIGDLYEYLTSDVLPEECDELPEPLETVVQNAISTLIAVSANVAVSYQAVGTRPSEICEEFAEFTRKCGRRRASEANEGL